MIPLTDGENKSYEKEKVCCVCKKEFCTNENEENEFRQYKRAEIIAILQENLEELLIVFAI